MVFVPYAPVDDSRRSHSRKACSRELLLAALVVVAALLCAVRAHAQSVAPTRFTVVDAGTPGKPDVLLLPGLSSSRAVWDAEAKVLAPNYSLHLVQIDGFAGQPAGPNAGGAMIPAITTELHAYIAANRIHPVVIGHSFGGLLGLNLADKYPADVRKLVIVDALPFYALVFSPEATVESIKPQADAMRAQLAAMPDDQYAAMQPMMAAALVRNADGQKLVAAASAQSDRAVVLNAMTEDMATDLRPDLAGIRTQTLLLYPFESGSRQGTDPAKTDALYAAAYKTMPNVTLKRIDGSRHFIMYDQPAALAAAIEPFLK